MGIDWETNSQRFDEIANLYDQYRPGYPTALAETLLEQSHLPSGARLLEVGSGTGIATAMFAGRGFHILCVEPGANLVAVAARRFGNNSQVEFEIARFEDWRVREKEFDLVYCAQAWHWVPKQAGYAKAAAALKDTGLLALIWNMHPDPTGPIFTDIEAVYQQRVPAPLDKKHVSWQDLARQREMDIAQSGYFTNISTYHFPWSQRYDIAQYLGLLNTYSDHLALPDETRRLLYEGVAQAIEKHGGTIDKPYVAVLYLAQKAG